MIYILDHDPKKTSEMLDDKSLNKQILDIAQVLCNVHYHQGDYFGSIKDAMVVLGIPLLVEYKPNYLFRWDQWTRECKANYLYLVELGLSCEKEYTNRFNKPLRINKQDSLDILNWAENNVPDLPETRMLGYPEGFGYPTGKVKIERYVLPLVMPKKYHVKGFGFENQKDGRIVQSYRNYYQAKLKQRIKYVDKNPKIECYRSYNCWHKCMWTNRRRPEWLEV